MASIRCVLKNFVSNKYQSVLQKRGYTDNIKLTATKLYYADYGDPAKVVQKQVENFDIQLKPDEVFIKMLAAPVNPADINTIQGKYPVKPTLPSVPGNEGVAEVVAVGEEVLELDAGDRVVPLVNAMGTWRTHGIFPADNLFRIPDKLGVVEAATLTVNPCTAYRMLKDFTHLKAGDTVIQNGGNSACGQNVIQICRAWDVNTVSIVRNRPEINELKNYLKTLGATEVLTEEELRTTKIFKSGKLEKPRLALNCVGGKSATELTRHLQKGSPLVTYGGMSKEPVTVSTAALIFKDIQICGFWMTQWTKDHADSTKREEMFDDLIYMMTNESIHTPAYSLIPFNNYLEALNNTMTSKGMIGKKFILNFQN